MVNQLIEDIKTVKNLTEVALLLIQHERNELLPTILELMFIEVQQITDEYCVVKK